MMRSIGSLAFKFAQVNWQIFGASSVQRLQLAEQPQKGRRKKEEERRKKKEERRIARDFRDRRQSCEVAATECGQRRSFNGAGGMSDIEGKVTRVGVSERGQRTSFKIVCCNFCKGLFLKARVALS